MTAKKAQTLTTDTSNDVHVHLHTAGCVISHRVQDRHFILSLIPQRGNRSQPHMQRSEMWGQWNDYQ
ncbi:hypothetical protein Barb6_02033 [Bacteroidales bacterium Barb6]|nr:hypothetical protein Barb6_02033 [Bacteroidales bacterium Barb6]